MQDFKQLNVWQRAHQFTLDVYKETAQFPANEKYGITSQLRRASSSIAANIAEGTGRQTNKGFLSFLYISMGSVKECESFLVLAKDLKYLKNERLFSDLESIAKMLNRLIKSIQYK
ncbi:MAG: four helix bundle protein [archaeon]